jgi:hypothetical protein
VQIFFVNAQQTLCFSKKYRTCLFTKNSGLVKKGNKTPIVSKKCYLCANFN